jgi:adenosylcobinamide-GDP ribazoletransferase
MSLKQAVSQPWQPLPRAVGRAYEAQPAMAQGKPEARPMRPFTTRLTLALGFLSRLPMPGRVFAAHPDARLAESADTFALAGVVIALPAILVLILGGWLPTPVSAALALATLTAATGALHEDGLADCADAFFAPVSRERRLEIMKDSRIGTFAGLALIFQFAVAWASLTAILEAGLMPACVALVAASALSRAGLVWHWQVLPFARPGGLAESQGKPEWRAVPLNAASAIVVAFLCLVPFFGIWGLAMALLAAISGALAAMVLARGKIGGQTGDTLGLTQKLAEVFVIAALAGIIR